MRDTSRIVPIIQVLCQKWNLILIQQRWNLEGLSSILKMEHILNRSLVHLLVFGWCHVLIFIILHIVDVMFFLLGLIGLGRKPNSYWWSFCSSHFHLVEFCLQHFFFLSYMIYMTAKAAGVKQIALWVEQTQIDLWK